MTAQFVTRTHETSNIYTFSFRMEQDISFIAGQFLELIIDHENPDSRGIQRWFTISSSPNMLPLLNVTVRISKRPSSFKQSLFTLKQGDTVQIKDVMGDFVLPKNIQKPLAFMVYGIGVTPLGSMLRQLHDTNETRDIQIMYGLKEQTDRLWPDLLPVNTHYFESAAETMTYDQALHIIPDLPNRMLYVSGPESFVEKMLSDARKKNHPEHRLVGDFFHNY